MNTTSSEDLERIRKYGTPDGVRTMLLAYNREIEFFEDASKWYMRVQDNKSIVSYFKYSIHYRICKILLQHCL